MGISGRAIGFCVFIAFGGFLFGYDIGVISGCLIMPDFVQRFGEVQADGSYVLSSVRQSEITSLLSAGTFFGALFQTFTADSIGRRWSCMLWSVIFTIGVVIQTASETSLGQLLAGRCIAGLGVGALSCLVPLFNGEAAPREIRGTLIVTYQAMIAFGLFFAYIVDLASHATPGSASWRIPVGLQLLWGLILIGGMSILPESPRHLLFTGKVDEARTVIASLNNTTPESALTNDIIAELQEGLAEETAGTGGKSSWLEVFAPGVWQRVLIGCLLQTFQQWNGQNFYYYYGDTFFAGAGTGLSSYSVQAILGGVSFATIFPALYLVETLGRRKSLIIGALAEAPCELIAGLVGHFLLAPTGTPDDELTTRNKAGGGVLIAFAVLQVALYSLFWGPTPWVYLGESFPTRVRSKCIALGAATNWFWNFLLGYFSPRVADDIGPLILLVFFATLVMAAVYVYLFVPETKGLSLEQVDELYKSGVKPWKSATWQPTHGAMRRGAFQKTEYARHDENPELDTPNADRDRIEHAKQVTGFGKGTAKHEDEKIENVQSPERQL